MLLVCHFVGANDIVCLSFDLYLTASEVTNVLGIKLSDLNYLCSHASLACNEMIDTTTTTTMTRQIIIH